MEATGAPPKTQSAEGPLGQLSEREREYLGLVAEGLSNKEVGRQLNLTEKTVKRYMGNVLAKLQVRNRLEAALIAERAARGE